ncbi:hypothetical protein RR48_06935 [Papilio machaon]|uniref:Uncharacterized protein n=1 Tax=Papilio machaon TaxID=76193 RepID=A0A194RA83_PAPMA|nr:hypothetical protein RR48_06935 [Papilio machaon]
MPTATELHSTNIESSRETAPTKGSVEVKQAVTTEIQNKLNQSIPDCEDTLSSMKDINLNETPDYQQYHQPIHLSLSENESEDCMEQKPADMSSADEESKVSLSEDINMKSAPIVPKLKYKYDNDQWSPLNQSGKRCYDIRLLMQIKDDPLSKTKPIGVHLELSSIVKQHQEPQPFNPVLRPINDSLFPNFAKNTSITPRNTTPRDPKKDNRNINANSRPVGGRMTSSPARPPPPAPPAPPPQPVIRVSLAREEVQLSQTKNAWKPSRLKNAGLSEEERKTQVGGRQVALVAYIVCM